MACLSSRRRKEAPLPPAPRTRPPGRSDAKVSDSGGGVDTFVSGNHRGRGQVWLSPVVSFGPNTTWRRLLPFVVDLRSRCFLGGCTGYVAMAGWVGADSDSEESDCGGSADHRPTHRVTTGNKYPRSLQLKGGKRS